MGLLLSALALSAVIGFSLGVGAVKLSPLEVVSVLVESLGLGTSEVDFLRRTALLDLRLPRVLMGALVGGILSVAGAALQGLLRNPLADPGIVGTSSGAALAAALSIVLVGEELPILLPFAAFGGALTATLVVIRLARVGEQTDISLLLLLGIGMNALCGVGLGLATYLADDAQLRSLTFWQLGSLAGIGWRSVVLCGLCTIPCALMLMRDGASLNLLALGERDAWQLGANVEWLKTRVVILASLGVGAAVAGAGVLGFVGLAAPHLVRLLLGPDHRYLLPGSWVGGALLVLIADVLARTIVAPAELPIGILSSAIGTPILFFLLIQSRSGVDS